MRLSLHRLYLGALLLLVAFSLILLFPRGGKPSAARLTAEVPPDRTAGGFSDAGKVFDVWLDDYRYASVSERESLLAAGIPMAERHRDAFVELMNRAPDLALERALSISEFSALPVELQPYFARPINGVGSIDLRWATSLGESGEIECAHQNILFLDGEKLAIAEGWGGPVRRPQRSVPVNGIALGDLAVIASSGVRTLSADEIEQASTLFPVGNLEGLDPITNRLASEETAALVGGKVFYFESLASIERVVETLKEAEVAAVDEDSFAIEHDFQWLSASGGGGNEGDGPVDASPFQDDMLDVLFIRVDFSDFPGEPVTQAALEATLASVKNHVEDFSYNAATIISTVTPTVYRMPSTGASYAIADDNDGIQTDARALAAADYTIADYDVIAVFFPDLDGVPGSQITYGGLASIGGANHWINGTNNTGVILHEFGHNYGLRHANYLDVTQSLPGTYDVPGSREYGDIFDRMGSGNAPEGHFNHFAKNHLQWMPDSKVAEPTVSGTYRIYRFDHQNALSNPTLAVKVPMGGDVYYWVGYRQLYTSASYNLSDSAYIVAEGLSQGAESNLIDATLGSASPESEDRKDSGLEIGTPFVDSGVTFEATARGGTAPNEWIDVSVTFAARVGFVESELEIDEQAGMAWLTLRRQFSSAGTVTIDYSSADDSALAGTDYYGVSGSVTWLPGDSADKTIGIPIRPDSIAEGREDFTVTLSNPGGASLDVAATIATVSILDPGERYLGFTPNFFNNAVYAIAALDDGKVLIGGTISHTSGEFGSINNLARLNADGSVDSTFLTGTGFDGRVTALVVQSDGKILVGGQFTTYDGTTCNRIVRLESNGQVDSSFVTNLGAGADDDVNAIALEPGGSILVAGDFDTLNAVSAQGIARLNANGSPATALSQPFASGSSTATSIDAIVVQNDGKIMVGGFLYTGFTPTGFGSGIARLNANGSLDGSFDPDAGAHAGATNSLRQVQAIVLLADGDYLIGGSFTNYDETAVPYLARINSDGGFDSGFSPPAFNNTVTSLLLEPSGKVVVGGRFTSPEGGFARLDTDGNLDGSFEIGSGGSPVLALAHGPGSTLFGGGNFFQFNGSSSRPIIKLAGGMGAYDLWVAENFSAAQITAGDAIESANPDGDAFNNVTEWAMGTSPTVSNPDPSSVGLVANGGADYLQLTLARGGVPTGAWLVAQFSDDLVNWTPDPAVPGGSTIYTVLADSLDAFVVRDLTPFTTRRFVRFGGAVPD